MTDKAKRFTITVGYKDRKANARTWQEPYTEICDDAEAWSRALIDRFNEGLRPGEMARRFVSVEVHEDDVAPTRHAWTKTNLTTLQYRGRMYDAVTCERCGITGKRFRLSSEITRDSQFKPRVYMQCNTASAHLEEKRARAQSMESNT